MPDYKPTVLFPEVNDPAVVALRDKYAENDLEGVNLCFDDVSLEDAATMLRNNEVDAVVAGVAHDTPTVLRTAINNISKEIEPDREKRNMITSFFVMERDGQEPIFYSDCAVHETPDAETLVTIAEQTSESVRHLGYEPVVAFLSLSTFGSASHLSSTAKIKQAAEDFKSKHPEVVSYGEIQYDAARNPDIFAKKAAAAEIELIDGKMPNVFIFPDGLSGNIAYKALEQDGGWTAVGPMLDGTYKDIHDSSRGATPEALAREAQYAAQLFKARHQAGSDQRPDQELIAA